MHAKLSKSRLPRSKWSIIEEAVPGRANGLFLYAKLAMDAFLEPGINVENVMAQVPRDLNVLYTDLLQEHAKRSGISLSVQNLLLQSVTHATKPLRLLELAEMCRVIDSDDMGRDIKTMKDFVRIACGPLLEVLPNDTLSVVHHSFTEYLKGVTRVENDGGYPVLQPGPSHSRLALTCSTWVAPHCISFAMFAQKTLSGIIVTLSPSISSSRAPRTWMFWTMMD